MSGLRWGILAAGGIADIFTSDLRIAGIDVRAVGSRELAKASAFAAKHEIASAYGSYEELVEDPGLDIIYVATPHPMHAEAALLALDHGKHVLVEKAFTLNAAEARAVRDRARERGLLAMEAMWTRYLPHMVRIRELLAAGVLGELRGMQLDHSQSLPRDPLHRVNNPALGGGALLDLGIYPVSFAWDVLGAPEQVLASATFTDTGVDAEIAMTLRYAEGAIATSFSSLRSRGPNTATILGEQARIEIDPIWFSATSFRVIDLKDQVIDTFESRLDGRGMQYQALAAEAIIAAGERDSRILPIEESVAIMETLDEIRAQIGLRYPGE